MNPGIERSFIFTDKTVLITSKCRATFRGLSIKHNHEENGVGTGGIMPPNGLPHFHFL